MRIGRRSIQEVTGVFRIVDFLKFAVKLFFDEAVESAGLAVNSLVSKKLS